MNSVADKQEEKDRATLNAIARIYCDAHHGEAPKDSDGLCSSCCAAVESTMDRVSVCPFGHAGNCEDCSVKCQRGGDQKRIKEIMKYAAPRMFLRHPLMSLEYLRKKFRKE